MFGVDLDFAGVFEHFPKGSRLPHQDLGQGSNMIDLISTPVDPTWFLAPCEVSCLHQDVILEFQTMQQQLLYSCTYVLGNIWGQEADTVPSEEERGVGFSSPFCSQGLGFTGCLGGS